MKFVVVFALPALLIAQVQVASEVKQGEVLRIVSPAPMAKASLAGKTVPFYPQSNGSWLALMPIEARTEPKLWILRLERNGAAANEHKVTVTDARFRIQNIRATKAMKSLEPMPGEMETMKAYYETVTPQRFFEDEFLRPTPECTNSPFGVQRYHNGKPTGRYHRGVDLRSPMGTPIRAAASGTVKVARMWTYHGGTVGIDHGQGMLTTYVHLSKTIAAEGAKVKAGDVIGLVGSTGFSTGPHLHWAVHIHGTAVNPLSFLKEARFCK
jgi:murein DD-endopeptidase MepM/ murein hydrolase activator NlpD